MNNFKFKKFKLINVFYLKYQIFCLQTGQEFLLLSHLEIHS